MVLGVCRAILDHPGEIDDAFQATFLVLLRKAAGLPTGIPIYVDPQGLQDADQTMKSTSTIDLEGIPLRTTLALLLRQLHLGYKVEGGVLLITDLDYLNP